MKKIPLTQGQFALVDDEEYEYLAQWKWHARKDKHTYYAVRNGERKTREKLKYSRYVVRMHRVVLNAPLDLNVQVDHINGNGLDNRKANLRLCSNEDNSRNRVHANKNNSSGFSNINWHSRDKVWSVRVGRGWRRIAVGSFSKLSEAKKALKQHLINEQ